MAWYIMFGISMLLVMNLGFVVHYLIFTGVGVWGLNNPVMWAFDITNFVFWVGIGHAGTLISAILFLFRQKWRTGINRFAEAMTIFAVICAGLFPGIHVGRVWLAYWLFPIPNQMAMWPQFRSPLLWDVFAVSTYFTVSLLFWYVGLVPDLATMRDRAKGKPVRPPMVNRNKNDNAYHMGVVNETEPLYSVAIQLNTLTALGMATLKLIAENSVFIRAD